MTDDAFRLTALDARRYDFGNALRGYDRARVDQFREQVAEELERLARVNQELEAKARNFHEQLRAFRERDKALNDALVSAQQLRGDIRQQAEREAQLIVREAQAQAERALASLRGDIRRAEEQLQQLAQARRGYVAQIRHVLERQLLELAAAEADGPEVPAPAVAPVAAPAPAPATGSSSPDAAGPPPRFPDAPLRITPPSMPPLDADAPEILDELRDLPSRPAAPTPSWLDAVEERE